MRMYDEPIEVCLPFIKYWMPRCPNVITEKSTVKMVKSLLFT